MKPHDRSPASQPASVPTQGAIAEKFEAQWQDFFRLLAENIQEVFWISSLDKQRIHYVSPGYEKIWGRSCDSLYEDPAAWLAAIHPDDREHVSNALPGQVSGAYDLEYRVVRPDGEMRWVRDRAFPVVDAQGRQVRLVGMARDITEEKRLARESEYRLQQVIQMDKLSSLGTVVAGVAHEINNPNSFITYNVPLLKETWAIFEPIVRQYAKTHPQERHADMDLAELCDDMREIINAIEAGTGRIERVVNSLKAFARKDGGPAFAAVDLNEVVKTAMTIVGAQLRKQVGEIRLDLTPELPAVSGNFQKLEQVVVNLLINAARAIPEKAEGRLWVRTRWIQRLEAVLVEVEDNGTGMPPEVCERIFEPFFTTHREQGGTGLGLSISHRLVQEHRGVLSVFSKPAQGTRFTIYLPMGEKAEFDLRPTILCVDDDPLVLRMLNSYFLTVKKISFTAISDSGEVLDYLEAHPEVDIVLSDIMMPNIDGWELFARIKARFPLMGAILYSGYPEKLKPPVPGGPKPDFLLEKPINIRDLFNTMNTIIRQRL